MFRTNFPSGMAVNRVQPIVILTEKDVPGAKLQYLCVQDHSCVILKRWLECRGLPVSGTKSELVKRCEDCIAAGQDTQLTITIDGGKWFEQKVKDFYRNQPDLATDNSQCPPPVLPIIHGWKSFPSDITSIPKCFNQGNIYHHMIESAKFVGGQVDDDDDDAADNNTLDVGTEKPLRKGMVFFKSGHVQNIQECVKGDNFFCKSRCMSSYDVKKFYNPSVIISAVSGFIRDAACDCRSSVLGRCNHVAALLFSLLDYSSISEKTSSTSKLCNWNTGRKKEKRPRALHEAVYSRVSGQPVQRRSKNSKETLNFDPRPENLRVAKSQSCVNNFMKDMQSALKGEKSAWQHIIPIKYSDFSVDKDDLLVLKSQCEQFLTALKCPGTEPSVIEHGQRNTNWFTQRSLRVTSSTAKAVSTASMDRTRFNLLRKGLWNMAPFVSTDAIMHGVLHENDARDEYTAHMQTKSPGFQVEETGLWTHPGYPSLACSPDGIAMDPDVGDGLIEIKCPYNIRDSHPSDLSKLQPPQRKRFFCTLDDDGKLTLKVDHIYYYQVQMQLGLTGKHFCDFIVWTKKGMSVQRIYPDIPFWRKLEQQLTAFHRCYVIPEFFLMRVPRGLMPYKLCI